MIQKQSNEIVDLIVNKISARAEYVHKDVNQMYDDKPYFYHLAFVVGNTIDYLTSIKDEIDNNNLISIVFGAYFHDSIEDARLTYNDVHKIALEFMEDPYATQATEIVYALTNEKGRTREERANDKYYQGIRETPYANLIKFADRMANLGYSKEKGSGMNDKYKKEMEHFLASISNDKYQFEFNCDTYEGCIIDGDNKIEVKL